MPKLHDGQKGVIDAILAGDSRFSVLACGRRWGKTRLGGLLCVYHALHGGRVWWVAPTYKVANIGWKLIERLSGNIPGTEKRLSERTIIYPTGGEIGVRSADNPDSLRGEGLDYVVLDECAYIKEDAWQSALRPALSDRQGGAMFISTPSGRNWFYRLYVKGVNAEGGYRSWHFPTSDNPFIADEEIEAARESLPERIFRQEYMAEFLDDAGGVFRYVRKRANATLQESATDGHDYVFGIDWGQSTDYTVIAVLDATTGEFVFIDRFSGIDYNQQRGRISALYSRFKPYSIFAEANAMGQPNIDALIRDGLPVRAFTTTNKTKVAIVDSMALAFENGAVKIPDDETAIMEFESYTYTVSQTGVRRFSAPSGLHDDIVMACCIAWYNSIALPKPTGEILDISVADYFSSGRHRR
ncbi:MAG: hypothetical protein CUN56_12205 [Phototrophicales bacterium]|nr:MAG: hypothetical protein CUN56_12205 [Phototrophicales bacterium]